MSRGSLPCRGPVGATALAASAVGVETRVGAQDVAAEVLAGPPTRIATGQRLGEAGPRAGFVVATGVAANTGRLTSREDELSGVLDPIARNSRTSAVLGTRQGKGVLAGGGRDLSPAQPGA